MKAKNLSLSSFRNIEKESISFSPKITFLLGDNAQGKTNVLEALYLFARGKSFRGAPDREMVSFKKNGYRLSLTYEKEDREEELFLSFGEKEKIRKKNGVLLEKQSELIGNFRAVLFCPDHLQMVKGSPSERRRFLDIAISQCYPVYLSVYAKYQKILDERNSILKAMQKGFFFGDEMLHTYSEGLARAAAEIFLYRHAYVERLKKEAKKIMDVLSSGKEELDMLYRSDIDEMYENFPTKEEAIALYKRVFSFSVEKEKAAGVTLYGIHRDELLITLSGMCAKDYASQGQQRSIVLSLKMAEGIVSGEICREMPVYLFDDVLSELDEGRRKFLLSGMKGCQFIVTGCDENVLSEISEDVRVIKVKNGKFEE